jgi:aspartyl aminopeptidase
MHPARPEPAVRFIDFLNASPTPFHVVANASRILEEKGGFVKVRVLL